MRPIPRGEWLRVALGIARGFLLARVALHDRCAEALATGTPYSEERYGLGLKAGQLLLATWFIRTRNYVEPSEAGAFMRVLWTQVLRDDGEEGTAAAEALAGEPGTVARLHRMFTALASEMRGHADPLGGWFLLVRFGSSFWEESLGVVRRELGDRSDTSGVVRLGASPPAAGILSNAFCEGLERLRQPQKDSRRAIPRV